MRGPSRDGERREEKLFIDVTVWDRQAENCCQYLKKGSPIHVEGSLRMDTWDDKSTGEKRSKIRVHADRVQFLDSRRGDPQDDAGNSADDDASASSREASPRRAPRPQVELRALRASPARRRNHPLIPLAAPRTHRTSPSVLTMTKQRIFRFNFLPVRNRSRRYATMQSRVSAQMHRLVKTNRPVKKYGSRRERKRGE